jgi:hypothetical protein
MMQNISGETLELSKSVQNYTWFDVGNGLIDRDGLEVERMVGGIGLPAAGPVADLTGPSLEFQVLALLHEFRGQFGG